LASAIVPVYNPGRYLKTAIDSILRQTVSAFEVLLLNDGSTDGSLEILQGYAECDPRCRIYSWPNQGLIKTLNAGAALARGDILIRMDADDICRSDRVEKQLKYLEAHPDCVAVGSRALLIDDEGLPIREMIDQCAHDAIDAEYLNGRMGIVHPSSAIRREAFEKIGGYREEYQHAEDADLFLRLAEIGKLANLPEVLLEYRQHLASIGYSQRSAQRNAAKRAIEDACARRNLPAPPLLPLDQVDAPTVSDVHRKWAWWALGAGNLHTARKHALNALKRQPASFENWRLCAFVLRGY